MATKTNTEYSAKLDGLYAITPKLPLDEPDPPLVQNPEQGDVRIKGSRVQLHLILEDYLERGATLEGLVDRYSSLTVNDFTRVIHYYERNKEIVDEYIAHTKVICNLVDAHVRSEFPQDSLRQDLLARFKNGSTSE